MIDLVCYHADLGRPYLPLIEKMTASARAVMPDIRLVLMTPTPKRELARCFDLIVPLEDYPATHENLVLERSRASVSWMLQAPNPVIFSDPDIIFQKAIPFDGSFDVGFMWRGGKVDQPINTGIVLATPGHDKFWKHYGNVVANLTKDLHRWWGDQLAFNLMTGICHRPGDRLLIDDARVALFDARITCTKPEDALPEAWAHHYKGPLKEGQGWDEVFPSRFADGMLSAGFACRTATAEGRNLV